MRSGQKPPQGSLKPKPLTSQSLQRPVKATKEPEQNQQKEDEQELTQDEISVRNTIAEKIDQSIEFRNNQQWDSCFENLFLAFKMNEKFVNDAQLSGDILSQIGFAHWNRGDLDQALEFYDNALKTQIKYAKKDHPDIAVTYTNIGTIHLDRKNYAKAISFFDRAIKIQEQQLNSNHPDLISTYSNYGSALFGKDEYLKALEYFRKSQKIEEKIYGMEHIYLTGSLKNIAVIYQTMGEYAKALPVLERELKIKQKNLDKNHIEIGLNFIDISVIKEMKEDFKGALLACEEGLQILYNNLQTSDPKLKQCEERCEVLRDYLAQTASQNNEPSDNQSMHSQQSRSSLSKK